MRYLHIHICTHVNIHINMKDWFVGSETLYKCCFTVSLLHVAFFFGAVLNFLRFICANLFFMYVHKFIFYWIALYEYVTIYSDKFFIIRNTTTIKVLVVICLCLYERYSRAVLFNTLATSHMWVFKFKLIKNNEIQFHACTNHITSG